MAVELRKSLVPGSKLGRHPYWIPHWGQSNNDLMHNITHRNLAMCMYACMYLCMDAPM